MNYELLDDIRNFLDLTLAADYFSIVYLRNDVTLALRTRLEKMAEGREDNSLLFDDKMCQLFHAARLAYTMGPNLGALRDPMVRLVVKTDFLLVKDSRFQRELINIPEFGLALIKIMSSSYWVKQMRTCGRTEAGWCTECRSKKSQFAETSLVSRPAHDRNLNRAIVGVYEDCFAKRK